MPKTRKQKVRRNCWSARQRKWRQLQQDVFQRTMNGNGMNPSLPPLPVPDNDGDDVGNERMGSNSLDTLFGHPYGVLPYGNIHFSHLECLKSSGPGRAEPPAAFTHPDNVRLSGMGKLSILNDEQLLFILQYCDGATLGKIVQSSRFMYVAGHHEELWRDLVLQRWGSVGFTVPPPCPLDLGNHNEENADADCTNGVVSDELLIHEEKKDDVDNKIDSKDHHVSNRNVSQISTYDTEIQKVRKKSTISASHRPKGCWKDIYSLNYYNDCHKQQPSNEILNLSKEYLNSPPERHIPIQIRGIYSDTFIRSWLCRSFTLQPSWLSTHTVPTIRYSDYCPDDNCGINDDSINEKVTGKDSGNNRKSKLSKSDLTQTFLTYERNNVPLLIKGASLSWDALHKWSLHHLLQATKHHSFRATSGAAPLPAQFKLENYVNYCKSTTEESPLYLFDRTFGNKCPQLINDFEGGLRRTCPFWDNSSDGCNQEGNMDKCAEEQEVKHGHDLLRVLGEKKRPDYQWLIIGPERSGSSFHIDPNATHAWNAPIRGAKRWIFYPPGTTPPGIYPSPSGDDVCMPISIGEWFLTYWDEHVRRRDTGNGYGSNSYVDKERPLECTVFPGDVLFVPHGWWHMVLNLGEGGNAISNCNIGNKDDKGVSIALTRNYVSSTNLPDVLRFFDTRIPQISGCRDRQHEAIPPEELGQEFRKALKEYDGGKWAKLLEEAERKARAGWGCKAWKDDDYVDYPNNEHRAEKRKLSCVSDNCDGSEREKMKRGKSILERAKSSESSTTVTTTEKSGFAFSFI